MTALFPHQANPTHYIPNRGFVAESIDVSIIGTTQVVVDFSVDIEFDNTTAGFSMTVAAVGVTISSVVKSGPDQITVTYTPAGTSLETVILTYDGTNGGLVTETTLRPLQPFVVQGDIV